MAGGMDETGGGQSAGKGKSDQAGSYGPQRSQEAHATNADRKATHDADKEAQEQIRKNKQAANADSEGDDLEGGDVNDTDQQTEGPNP